MTETALREVTLEPIEDAAPAQPSPFEGLLRRASAVSQSVRAVPHVGTWAGLSLTALGAVLLLVAWVRTAALTQVSLQVPYVVSAGFTGLGLIIAGLTIISIAAKQEDARERRRQVGELRELLAQVRSAVEDKR